MSRSKEEKQYERKQRKKLKKEQKKQKEQALEIKRKNAENWRLFSAEGFIKFLKISAPWLLSVAFLIFWLVIEVNSNYSDFSKLPVWIISSNLCLNGIILFFGFFRKKEFPLMFKISFACLAVYPWLNSLLPEGKLIFAIKFIMLTLLICTEFFQGGKGNFFYLAIPSIWFFVIFGRQFNELNLTLLNINFYIIAGVLSLAITILLDHLREKEKISPFFINSKSMPYELYLFLVCFFSIFSFLITINYSLDFSQGTKQIYTIDDKIADSSGRTVDYYLVVDNTNEKMQLSVDWTDYSLLEIGDTVTVTQHEGFLGDEYLIVNE